MDRGRTDRTNHILTLTLEIVYLLTGEEYIIISKNSGERVTQRIPRVQQEPQHHSMRYERNNDLKILELTNKIIYLLTGETCDYTDDDDDDDFYGEVISDDHQPLDSGSDVIHLEESPHSPNSLTGYRDKDQRVKGRRKTNATKHTKRQSTTTEGNSDHSERPITEQGNNLGNAEQGAQTGEESEENDDARDVEPSRTQHKEKPAGRGREEPSSTTRKTAPGIKTHDCPECKETFTCNSDLLRHQSHHRGSTLFTCSVCGKNFTSKSNLVKHHKIHTGEKPYSCSECGKSFREKYYLLSHQSVHLGPQLIECPQCGKGYTSKSNLAKHQRIHTGEKPFVCSECGKSFNQRSVLVSHHRTHTGEKPFSCALCGKRFTDTLQLERHRATHSGEKPFACAECGKAFCQKNLLIKHLSTHK